MNMKEVIRAQVRQELHQLEVRCLDMTSLLQGLGIFISNAVKPSPDEVGYTFSCKVFLLTFMMIWASMWLSGRNVLYQFPEGQLF